MSFQLLPNGKSKYSCLTSFFITLFSKFDKLFFVRAQWLINLEIPVIIRSLKSSNVDLGLYLDGRLLKFCLSVVATDVNVTETADYNRLL